MGDAADESVAATAGAVGLKGAAVAERGRENTGVGVGAGSLAGMNREIGQPRMDREAGQAGIDREAGLAGLDREAGAVIGNKAFLLRCLSLRDL